MNGFRTKFFFALLILTGLAFPVFAQNTPDVPTPPTRGASFIATDAVPSDPASAAFSGLAAAAPTTISTHTANAPPASEATPDAAIMLGPVPVAAAPLPNVSPESIGIPGADSLGAPMWQGTSRSAAEQLLSIVTPTSSPLLNQLTQHLLLTAATPPEGVSDAPQKLTSARIEKLIAFGSSDAAWDLATHADSHLVDDASIHLAAARALTGKSEDICGKIPNIAQTHITVDWQKIMIACQLRGKDSKAAQVALDVYRAQSGRDNVFIDIADKNILTAGTTLPLQLTPLSPETVALLQRAGLNLPDDIYAHADPALAAALLQIPAQQDVARLALGERVFERGLISDANLTSVYHATNFSTAALAAALSTSESGLRLHALLFRAAEDAKDPAQRIALAIKFIQSSPPVFQNNAGSIAAAMVGDIKPEALYAAHAIFLAQIYMLAGKNDLAATWLRLMPDSPTQDQSTAFLRLWPQFALAGLEPESSFAPDLNKWLASTTKNTDASARDTVSASLLLMDAAGIKIPDAVWDKILSTPHNEKRVSFSPLLSQRLSTASNAGRRAETVLLAVAAAGDEDIGLPTALDITRALRQAGFKDEASIFARQQIALLAKTN